MSSNNSTSIFRCIVLGVVKHAYVPNGVASHPRFQLAAVADDPDQPAWVHERNQKYADLKGIPYIQDVERAIRDVRAQVAVVTPEAERHADLSVRAVQAGLHVVQDKPMSNKLSECDRIVQAVKHNRVKFVLWNRNGLPAIQHARKLLDDSVIGKPRAIHIDFYFSKDAGPPKGSRKPGDPPLNWLDMQIAAHVDGSDGGVGKDPMGELQIEGIYPLAYMHFLTGLDVKRVFARTTAHFHQLYVDNNIDDLASVTLEMNNGMLGTLSIGRIGAASHPDIGEIKLHIIGTDGAIVISEARPEVGIYYRDQPDKEFRHKRLAIDNDFYLMENFARAIDHDGETVLDAVASRNISAIVDAALESGRTGKPVDVK